MSVKMTRGEGVTVVTVTANAKSYLPPLCQILGALCYSPICCSVSENIRRLQSSSQSALGVLQLMVGVLNIGLGAILYSTQNNFGWLIDFYYFPFWMGALFMAFGILCILSEKFPSPCIVLANGLVNLAGVGFAIAAIVMYSINMYSISIWWLCRKQNDYYSWRERTTPSPSATEDKYLQQCMEAKVIILVILRAIHIVLIVLSVLQLCLGISSTVLGFKTLSKNKKETSKTIEDQEQYEPLLEEVTTKPTA